MQYGIPTTTLMGRVSGSVPFGKRSGPVKYLSDEEENELVHFVTECANVGYNYSRGDVITIVQDVHWFKIVHVGRTLHSDNGGALR